ncbi:MAG: cysteine hydrolase family protein [Clostridium sp.]
MKKLLVVVDYQKDFVDGALGFPKAKELEEGIYNKVSSYLNENQKVIFTYDTHKEDYLETREGKNLPVVHCVDGTGGHELFGKLNDFKNNESTLHLKKYGFGLSAKELLDVINYAGEDVDYIEVLGIVTNMCVISNVVSFQSQYTNAEIVVDGALSASFDNELHEKALDVIESIQVKVINRGN